MARNSAYAVISQIILIIFGFINNLVLNHVIGEALVGVNSVSSNIMGILSVTELGFSSTVVFHLYRVLSEKDEHACACLMNLYRTAYRIIAAVIGVLGIVVSIFVHNFMRENPYSVTFVRVIFLLWVARTVLAYVLGYRRSILIADQKEYIVTTFTTIASVAGYLATILLVTFTGDYISALIFTVAFESIMNICLNIYVSRHYPYLSKLKKEKIGAKERSKVFSDMKNIFFSKVAQKIFTSTDSIIISAFIGVALSGLFNNYTMVIFSVVNLIIAVGNSLQPTVANLFLDDDKNSAKEAFHQLAFLFFLIAALVMAPITALINLFVGDIWLGERFLLDMSVVVWMCVNAGILILNQPVVIVMNSAGLFRQDRNISIIGAFLNLGLSLILVIPLGINGVLFGSIAANVFCMLSRVYAFFRDFIHGSVKEYLFELLIYIILVVAETIGCIYLSGFIATGSSVADFIIGGVLCMAVPLALNILLYSRTKRMKNMLGMLSSLVKKK